VFEEEEDPTNRSFFSEIISSISDVKFSHDGRYILARDYLSLRIWDVNMEARPLKTIQIHDHLRGKLCDLYENDCIFDKFECTWSGDDKCVPRPIMSIFPNRIPSRNVLTGSYHNYLRIFDIETMNDVVLQADKSAFKAKKIGGPLPGNKQLGAKNGIKPGLKDAMQLEPLDFNKKILHASWHPRENTIAVCVLFWSVRCCVTDIMAFCRSLLRTICSCTAPRDSSLKFQRTIFIMTILHHTSYTYHKAMKHHALCTFFWTMPPFTPFSPPSFHTHLPLNPITRQTFHSFAAIHLSIPFINYALCSITLHCQRPTTMM
jgi:hypothetical protein